METDVVVIGAGPGGYTAGIRLGQLGVSTVVVERDRPGGVCLNVGCIPSKALITAAKTYDHMGAHARTMGIEVQGARLDWAETQKWKNKVVRKLTGGVEQLVKANGSSIVVGEAFVKGPGLVEVTTGEGKTEIRCKQIIVATGSRPIEIPGFKFDGERICASRHALSFPEVPKRLVVVGGGYIGLELGMMFAKVGTEVEVVEMLPTVLAGFDEDLVRLISRSLKKKNINVHLESRAVGWEPAGEGAVVTVEAKDGSRKTVEGNRVLVTVGRRPNSAALGLEACGVEIDRRGFISVDAQRRTNVPGIWAVGDVAGGPMLAHKAYREAEVAAEAIAGHASAFDVRAIPAVCFTDPEVATVGMSERDAAEAGRKVIVGKVPMAAVSRAVTAADTDGFVKVIADADSHEILGTAIIGSGASELIAEAALAIEMTAFVEDVGLTIHAHPTLAEGYLDAARNAIGEAIHILNR